MTAPEDEAAVERDLASLAHGDPGVTRVLRRALQRLATGIAGDELREMANEVLAGRAGLRSLALSGAYGVHLNRGLERFLEDYAALSPEQQRELRETGRRQIQAADEDR
jgi:hypothetical protein